MIEQHLHADGVDLDGTLRILTMLPGDPTVRLEPGHLERATHTPDGPGTISATWTHGSSSVHVRTEGPGANWLASRASGVLGIDDHDAHSFEPADGALRDLWRRHRGLRVPRTGTVWHDLCWLIVQQRIQRLDAAQQWRRLVERYGNPAPGSSHLLAPPDPLRLAAVPSHDFHQIGIERRRADTLRAAARARLDLQHLDRQPVTIAAERLQTIPGVGAWTTSTLAAITWGDPDTVITGDSGIPSLVSWVLDREHTSDDRRLHELLEPFRPHRYRVIQLAFASGRRPPRRHPRPRRTDIRRH
jgi:3-methyladenine DNA glycosylase/8-oxoguanine DNA glycosylase